MDCNFWIDVNAWMPYYHTMKNNGNSHLDLYHKALDFLARRDYSYHELFIKLHKYSDDEKAIIKVLDEMVAKKFLDEERYIENFIAAKSKRFGSLKIKYLLKSKVDNSELVNRLYQKAQIDEQQIASLALTKKYKSPPENSKEHAKYLRFLLSRGFSMEVAIAALKNAYISCN